MLFLSYICRGIVCAKHLKDKNSSMAEEKKAPKKEVTVKKAPKKEVKAKKSAEKEAKVTKSAEQEAQEQVAAAQAQAAAQQAAAQKMVEDQQKAMKKTLLISTILSFVTSIGSMLMGKFLNRR